MLGQWSLTFLELRRSKSTGNMVVEQLHATREAMSYVLGDWDTWMVNKIFAHRQTYFDLDVESI